MAFIINAFQRCKAMAKFQTPVNEICVSIKLTTYLCDYAYIVLIEKKNVVFVHYAIYRKYFIHCSCILIV